MFLEFIAPAIACACQMFGGVGVGYEVHGVGVSLAWVDKHVVSGKIDPDTMMVAVSYQALHFGKVSVGPYVGRTFALDGKHGDEQATVAGIQLQVSL